jgi:DNA-binding CsgD family transcriptional regulator/PAS domain-containing protein
MPRSPSLSPEALALDLYAAALDGLPLDAPLHAMGRALGAEFMLAHRYDTSEGAAHAGFVVSHNLPLAEMGDYASHWFHLDPWVAPWRARGPGVVNLGELVPAETVERSAFWNEFLLPRAPTFHGLALRLDAPRGDWTFLNFWRQRGSDPFGEAEGRLLTGLMPHIGRALAARARLAASGRALSALDALRDGVAVFDAVGQLRLANTALRVMAGEQDGLALTPRAVVLADRAAQAAMMQALAGALHDARATSTVFAPRASGAEPWRIRAVPVPRGAGPLGGEAGAVLIVTDTAHPPAPAEPLLIRLFGLTAAEAALAASLLAGRSLAEHARARRIAHATARTQLARVLDKTGCRRQAELVARLAPLLH